MPRFKKDLEAAGIPYEDARGHVGDFHSLRVSYITWLSVAGALPMAVKEAARHSSLSLTEGTYTDAGHFPTSATILLLPDVTAPASQIEAQRLVPSCPEVSQADRAAISAPASQPI